MAKESKINNDIINSAEKIFGKRWKSASEEREDWVQGIKEYLGIGYQTEKERAREEAKNEEKSCEKRKYNRRAETKAKRKKTHRDVKKHNGIWRQVKLTCRCMRCGYRTIGHKELAAHKYFCAKIKCAEEKKKKEKEERKKVIKEKKNKKRESSMSESERVLEK